MRYSFLLILLVSFMCRGFTIEAFHEKPRETVILQFPDHSETNWKEISHIVNKNEGIIERIPVNQTIENWSELIFVFFLKASSEESSKMSLDDSLERIREYTLSSSPNDSATWQIIEKDSEGVIYEWILHKSYDNIPIQHIIYRAFLTDSGFHQIGFNRRNGHMDAEERASWIRLLREHASVIPYYQAKYKEGLSLLDKLQDSVVLGAEFLNWKVLDYPPYETEHGLVKVCYTPPTLLEPYLPEFLDISTMPNVCEITLSQFFENKKKTNSAKFLILEESPIEIIYSYCYPSNDLMNNEVVRILLTDLGFYSFTYLKALDEQMTDKEILRFRNKLKTIQVKHSSKSKIISK